MAAAVTAVRHSVEVPADPETAFRLYTAEINRWWKRGTHYWNDRHRAVGLRFERPARPAGVVRGGGGSRQRVTPRPSFERRDASISSIIRAFLAELPR